MSKKSVYCLVNSATAGFALYQHLHSLGFPVRVAPAPREATSCCGMSILVGDIQNPATPELILDIENTARVSGIGFDRIVEVDQCFDPSRHKYC